MEQQQQEFYEKVYNGFVDIASKDPDRYIKIKPCQDKIETHLKLIETLRNKGIIK